MTAYYNILETIKAELEKDSFVTTVSQGDIYDIDLNKQTLFPLSHISINQVSKEGGTLRFSVVLFCMDVVDKSKEEVTDIFIGNDNEQDVLNTQLAVALRALSVFERKNEYSNFRLSGSPTFEPFTERFENYLAGWAVTFDIVVPTNMTIC